MRGKFRSISSQSPKAVVLLLLLLACKGTAIFSQKPAGYQINKTRDALMASASLGAFGACYYFQTKVPSLSPYQVSQLDPSVIPSYDRIAVHQYDVTARKLSNILIYSTFLARVGIFYTKKKPNNMIAIGVVGYQSIFLSQALAAGAKLTLRNRPFMYNPDAPLDLKTETDARFSFFSAHTTTVSTICFTTALAYQVYFPDSRYKKWIWASAITLPALEGYLRVKAGKHYPSDVVTGYLIGLGSSYLMHKLHLRK
jgi:hypothetical protein